MHSEKTGAAKIVHSFVNSSYGYQTFEPASKMATIELPLKLNKSENCKAVHAEHDGLTSKDKTYTNQFGNMFNIDIGQ